MSTFFHVFFNISFKEHLPEDGQNTWPKHVRGYDVYTTINLYIFLCIFLVSFLIINLYFLIQRRGSFTVGGWKQMNTKKKI